MKCPKLKPLKNRQVCFPSNWHKRCRLSKIWWKLTNKHKIKHFREVR